MILSRREVVNRIENKAFSISCDKCKEVFLIDDESSAVQFKIQNFVHIRESFGYGSFSDGDTYEADLCDTCAQELFKDIWRLKEDGE